MDSMKADVLLGLQWGDEGKGKVVDVLTPRYDVIARFQGGPNAGHTLEFEGIKHVLHTIPSGIFRENTQNLIGNGVVIDPIIFQKEIEALQALNVDVASRLSISKKAHLILPTHRMLDAASEAAKGNQKIGSTLKGIGPTYMDKTGRNGLRVGDIDSPDFNSRYQALKEKHQRILEQMGHETEPHDELAWFEGIEVIQSIPRVESEHHINRQLRNSGRVLAEGAQGAMLDIDFGSYPYVTSSNTICAGACTGLGIAPSSIGKVIGISKAYCTRVGSGPFPTELHDEDGELMRREGNEFGATTGRPRRCGWIDLPALRYSIMINGVTHLVLTKADVLSVFEQVKVCTHYRVNGELTPDLPFDISDVEPVYKTLPGWRGEALGTENALPAALEDYISFLESELQVPVWIVSLGPDRKQTIIREEVMA